MSVVYAFAKSTASFSVRAARFRAGTTRLLSVKGGSIPESESEKVLYSLGANFARKIESQLKPLLTKEEINTVILGFADSLNDDIPDECGMLEKYASKITELRIDRQKIVGEAEKARGLKYIAKYLEANPTAINTPSGLVYIEIVPGTGAQPSCDSTVEVRYHGTTMDGAVFDSTVECGETVMFSLEDAIDPCWQEGVTMMKVGGKATLVFPWIEYGELAPVVIPGGLLVYEVELINVL